MSKRLLYALLRLPDSQVVSETSPPSPPSPPRSPHPTSATGNARKPERAEIIEVTLRTASPGPSERTEAPSFPACPACGQTRYWLASGGRVLCGSKYCASAYRFQIVALEFHRIH
jgi:hypothetical protein